ncbi:hypothetical protein [Marinobacter bohaiensis]|uniref:hypothetical protein n=1 Tax=Marinobacter bohaiensis TaxID=2201898 RepID=UPI000DAF1E37|nr:hypothetical protein [Marinobacter bohaiensis]
MLTKWLVIPLLSLSVYLLAGCSTAPQSGAPDPRPDPENNAAAASGASGAVDVVRRYYAALSVGDYDTAYELWGDSGPPNQSYADFVSGYDRTRQVAVGVTGDVRLEGAAGSLYATVPVIVRATRDDGQAQRFSGHYILRRVNDVPGASAASLRWHLYDADLQPVR